MKSQIFTIAAIAAFAIAIYSYPVKKDPNNLERGDEVEIVNMPKMDFYSGCKVIYLAGAVTQNDNVVFVHLSGCDFQKRHEADSLGEDPTVDIFPLKYLRKVHK